MNTKLFVLGLIFFFTGTQLLIAQKNQIRDVSAFSEISLKVDANVHLKQGSTQLIELNGRATTLEKLVTEVKERKLVIRYQNESKFSKWKPGPVDIYVTMPQVDALVVSGSGSIVSEGIIESRILDLIISGSGNIKLGDLKSEKVSAKVSGSGNLSLSGTKLAAELKALISGSGNLKAIDFPTDNVDMKVSGSGNCWVNASKKLVANLLGSGNVIYRGNPAVETTILGSGKVKEE